MTAVTKPAANEKEFVKTLREKTGAGILDCRAALKESGWDFEKALDALREKGHEIASKRSGRETKAGKVESYIHGGGKIGVLVEVNCETDFVARTEDFTRFVRDLAMQIAATGARWVERSEVPAEVLERERAIQPNMEKFYEETCLLDQPFIRDQKVTIRQLLTDLIGRTGENIRIRRFAKFVLGD